MRTFAFVLCLFLFFKPSAQRACLLQNNQASTPLQATTIPAISLNSNRNFLTGTSDGSGIGSASTVIRIPVVIHVLYNTAAQNISDAQVLSGIEALNRDFRRRNADTINTPDRFKNVAADVEIEFVLAKTNPLGFKTNGIVRKQTATPAFDMDDKIKTSSAGGDDAWDTKKYLNIWIGNTRRLLGYATMPGSDESMDGVVINLTAFGTINTGAPYNMGRTAVHEVGHWLGLQHLWGDRACGDDGIDDTPKQGGYTSGCPSGIRSSCGGTTTGDMYMNYMDFTNDACMNLFTTGQKMRMRALFANGGLRQAMLASPGLGEPTKEEVVLAKEDSVATAVTFKFFPNPVAAEARLTIDAKENVTGQLYLLNANGQLVETISISAASQKISFRHLKAGVYFLKGSINKTQVMQKIVKL